MFEIIYNHLRELLTGEFSFSLYLCLFMLLIAIVLFIYSIPLEIIEKITENHKNAYEFYVENEDFVLRHLKNLIFQIFLIVGFTIFISEIWEIDLWNSISQYMFLIFILLLYIATRKIGLDISIYSNYSNCIKLMSNQNEQIKNIKVKNENELRCKADLIISQKLIEISKIRLDVLKHFLGPAILAPCISFLAFQYSEQSLPVYLYEIFFITIVVTLLLFWENFKIIETYHNISSQYESTLFRIQHELSYSDEEISKLNVKEKKYYWKY